MSETLESIGPKTHPATRPVAPDDPLSLHGFEMPGDPDLMLSMLVEEYARLGYSLDELLDLARSPFYVGFHGLWQLYGEAELRRRIAAILARCGVTRTTVRYAPTSDDLVQLDASRLTACVPIRTDVHPDQLTEE